MHSTHVAALWELCGYEAALQLPPFACQLFSSQVGALQCLLTTSAGQLWGMVQVVTQALMHSQGNKPLVLHAVSSTSQAADELPAAEGLVITYIFVWFAS